MNSLETAEGPNTWTDTGQTSALQLRSIQGAVRLPQPALGISDLKLNGSPLSGSLLGVQTKSKLEVAESYVRGNDQVLACTTSDAPPIHWHLYWRASRFESALDQLDLIVSLQTPALESYPSILVATALPAESVWKVPGSEGESQPFTDGEKNCDAKCVLMRIRDSQWSYLQMGLPEDDCELALQETTSGLLHLEQRMGGHFLEKGVIRRLRIRGLFLPRDNDLASAGMYRDAFYAEQPPLTT